MSSCSITFHNNPQAVFYGGQVLSGTAVLTTVKQKTIRAIYIEIDGRARVRWEESSTGTDSESVYRESYYGDEQYLDSKIYVARGSGGNSFQLMPGIHRYDFQVELPTQLPSSVEGKYGNIRYEVRLTVDRPLRFNEVFRKMFTVIETFNLNCDPDYKRPIMVKDTHKICCSCCGDEHIKVICRIPLSGYATGQKIPYLVRIENNSTVECPMSEIRLDYTLRFTAQYPETKSRYVTGLVMEKVLGPVIKSSNKEFSGFLLLPPVSPSSVNYHHIIETYYTITVKVRTSGCHRNASLTFPITIGTVPLVDSATDLANVITVQPTAPQMPMQNTEPPHPYAANAPPCYEDAINTGNTLANSSSALELNPGAPSTLASHDTAILIPNSDNNSA